MKLFKDKYRVESTRLKDWHYTSPGWYFITICTKDRQPFFGEIVNGKTQLSPVGETAHQYWAEILGHFPNTRLDDFVIMPNHVHGIVIIVETQHAASLQLRPTGAVKFGLKPGSISTIIRAYKSAVTRWARQNGFDDFAWLARFYDHIIRNEDDLNRIRQYIFGNPIKWVEDDNNPANIPQK